MSRVAFFRQSSWMMFATVAGGVMMWGVHFLSKKIPEAEYGTLVTLLAATIVVPAAPLQMVFAQQTALGLATGREKELTGMIRFAWAGTFLLWLLAGVVVLFFQTDIAARWQIANSAALWATLAVALGCLWQPMFSGLLQGAQNFVWLGWVGILAGASRLAAAAFIVLILRGLAAGIMTGILVSSALTLAVVFWQTRHLWTGPGAPFDWRKLLGQIIPLMLGFGAFQFLFSADTMFVKAYFAPETTAYYGAAGSLSRAVVWLVGPLASVMFPKIVHSAARSEKTNLLAVTLVSTGVLAAGGALGLWLLGPWAVRFVYTQRYVDIATQILPWYAGAMVLVSLVNVLVSNLLARSQFRVVPWLLAFAGGYAVALTRFHGSLVAVLQTLAVFCLAAFGVCAWFTWGSKAQRPNASA